ncbi:hypothetical protein [Pseudokineococcus sp. 1T1Z-3]|uniref:hypothetical protein n=1 Tax=Pseudokineococcus sp. 1T1Z-3 TaxID=3132745 RepID=UPI0030A913B9
MTTPHAQVLRRRGRGTETDVVNDGAFGWADVEVRLRAGESASWLSVASGGAVHCRPLFAAWSGEAFVFASKASALKTRLLAAAGRGSLAVDLGDAHLVAEGPARRWTSRADLERASRALREVFDWPTEVAGDELDAPYAAPTSGGPPFQAWALTPETVLVLPTDDGAEPTRFTFA